MTELKPCPFCGGNAYFKIDSNSYGSRRAGIDFRIKCKNCGIEPSHTYYFEIDFCPETEQGFKITEDDREEAIAEWNRRAKANEKR